MAAATGWKTDLQQEDCHPRAYGAMVLAAKEEVEKDKERQNVSDSCVAKKGHFKAHCSNRWFVPKTHWSFWWNTLPFQKGKAKVKAKTRSCTGRRNLGAQKMAHGTRWEPCPRLKRGALQVECLWRKFPSVYEGKHQEIHEEASRENARQATWWCSMRTAASYSTR